MCGGYDCSDGHATQPLKASQVLNLSKVREAVSQAHGAYGVADWHLAYWLDGRKLLQRLIVQAG